MTDALKILQEITTDYTIFEKDQVLTETQLNSVTDYLNDQTRLTRIYLLGVGVIAGLRVSVQNEVVNVTKGVGITTDSDLLYYSNDQVFDRFLEYGQSYPKYIPFYVGGDTDGAMIPVYELIPQGGADPRSPIFSLNEFSARTTKELKDMVAVLLMESYVNDPDICTGTDCDNLGQDCVNTAKLLLVDKASINSLLNPTIPTPDAAFRVLNEIVAERPLILESISSVSELAKIYRTVCTNIHNKLLSELPKIDTYFGAAFLNDISSYIDGGLVATVIATVEAGAVTAITITSGTGYTSAPTVIIDPPPAEGTPATVEATIDTTTGAVTGFINLVGGSGYTSAPTISFTGGEGSGATAIATVEGGAVTAITITSGTGYTSAPTISFTGGEGSGANAIATVEGGAITAITITSGGTGYTSAPTISFTGGGSVATATISSNAWITELTKIQTAAESDVGIQYYYDFLKDLVETYNQFRDLLFGDTTWCCPDINSFPKHLLLGNLVPGPDLAENRTTFYPSPANSQTTESLNHAKFLVRKLDTLIKTFQMPAASDDAAIRVTPSLFEEQPLEERAIPYYYQVNETNPIHKSWNYSLTQRGMATRNYSYNGNDYGAEGAAANPLTSQIGRFSFFRIEGHLGKNVETASSSIENEIKSKNLPFTVRSVFLGDDKTKVVKKTAIRYGDLHRLHYLLRQDASHQLKEVEKFSEKFKQEVDDNVTGEKNAQFLKASAKNNNETVTDNATSVAGTLNLSYAEYKANSTWKPDLEKTVKAASEFKFNLGDVVKTEFTTPFDTLIANTQFQWLDWLDEIIQKKDETEDEKLLLTKFISQNPGMEHFAGVVRGGTLILVYDNNQNIVADFMLPYYFEDKVEAIPAEPPLTKPSIRPDIIIEQGIRVLPSFNKGLNDFIKEPEFNQRLNDFIKEPEFNQRLNDFTKEPEFNQRLNDFTKEPEFNQRLAQFTRETAFNQRLVQFTQEPEFNQRIDQQQTYLLETYTKYVNSTANILSNRDKERGQGVDVRFTNPELDLEMREAAIRQEKVEFLRQQINKPNLTDQERGTLQDRAIKAELELAESLQTTTEYIATSGVDISSGSEGFNAMLEISTTIGTLSSEGEALRNLKNELARISKQTNNPGLKVIIENMLAR